MTTTHSAAYTLRQVGDNWLVVSDGSSVGFADRASAEQYLTQVDPGGWFEVDR